MGQSLEVSAKLLPTASVMTQKNNDQNNAQVNLNGDRGESTNHLLLPGCSSIVGRTASHWLPCVFVLAISCLFFLENPLDMQDSITHKAALQSRTTEPLAQTRLAEPDFRAQVPSGAACYWRFVQYHSSEFEYEWLKNIKTNQEGNVCTRFSQNYKRFFDIYVAELPKMTPSTAPLLTQKQQTKCKDLDRLINAQLELPHSVFSRFEYRWVCETDNSAQEEIRDRHFVYIEPLAGILRHPLACESMKLHLLRRDYMVVDVWAAHNAFNAKPTIPAFLISEPTKLVRPPRAYYFDLGASTWTTGSGGASQPWFCGVYQDMCIRFDDIFAWEVKKIDASQMMRALPGPIKPKYHWYNVPAATAEGDWDNPLTIVLSETRPDDLVIFKLDIDNWRVEETFVKQILASPALQSRIDEMFWEHHVNFQPMVDCCWRRTAHPSSKQEDSLKLFGALRSAGIRMHSWV